MAWTKEPLLAYLTNNIYGQSSYEQALWTGVCQAANELGVRLCTFAGNELDDPVANGRHVFDMALGSDADGYIINTATLALKMDHHQLQSFVSPFLRRPTACIAHEFPGAYFVAVDNTLGMRSMISHLIRDLGARRVAYVSGPLTHPEAADRFAAYKEVLQELNIPFDSNLVYEGTWVAPSGQKAVTGWLDKNIAFDAIAAANDLMALDVLNELHRRNIAVPSDVLVSGFDNIVDSMFSSPKLSTVAQPIEQIGYQAVKVMTEVLQGKDCPRRVLVPAPLLLRGSAPGSVARKENENTSAKSDDVAGLEGWLQANSASSDPTIIHEFGLALLKALTTGQPRIERELRSALAHSNREDMEKLGAFCQKSFHTVPQFVISGAALISVFRLIRDVENLIFEFRENDLFNRGSKNEEMAKILASINSRLAEAESLEEFELTAAKHFPVCGIRSCHIVFFDEEDNVASPVKMVASVVDGVPKGALSLKKTFESVQVIAGGLRSESTRDWVCLPLLFEGRKMGYVLLSHENASPFIYKPLVEQIANRVHNLLLIKRIESAEATITDKTTRLIALIRPMLPVISSAADLAQDQIRSMNELMGANKVTSGRITDAGRQVETLQKNLEKIVNLNDVIDELSETINVIAINAAIAAARAGADGKVFGVISSEIRNLSVQTKTNNAEISRHLSLLQNNSNSFFLSNEQARQAFSQLDTGIRELVKSIEELQEFLNDLNNRADQVLQIISS